MCPKPTHVADNRVTTFSHKWTPSDGATIYDKGKNLILNLSDIDKSTANFGQFRTPTESSVVGELTQ